MNAVLSKRNTPLGSRITKTQGSDLPTPLILARFRSLIAAKRECLPARVLRLLGFAFD